MLKIFFIFFNGFVTHNNPWFNLGNGFYNGISVGLFHFSHAHGFGGGGNSFHNLLK